MSSTESSTASQHSPPMFYGWTIVAMAMIALGIASGVTHSLYSVMVQPFSEAFDTSRTGVMAATASMAFLGAAFVSPLIGYLLQRQSVKKWMLIGGTGLVVGYLLLSQVTALWQISMIYFVCWSLGGATLGNLCSNTIVSNWFVQKRGRALGFAAVGMSLGAFIFPPLVTWLITQLGWRETCVFIAVIVLASLPLLVRYVVDHPSMKGEFPDGVEPTSEFELGQVPPNLTMGEMVKNKNFWLIAACIGIGFGCFNAIAVNTIPLATDLGVSRQTASFLLSVAAVCAMIGKIAVGTASDRLSSRLSLLLPLLCICIGCSLLMGRPGFEMLVVGKGFIGLAAGGMIPVWGTLVGRFFGQQSFPLVMGVMSPLLIPFVMVSGPFASWSNETTGSYDFALSTFIAAAVLAMVLSTFLRSNKDRELTT
jgi:MFS family permease